MGRGNISTHYECEGLFYLDRDFIDSYYKVIRNETGKVSGCECDVGSLTSHELRAAGIAYDYDASQNEWAFDYDQSCQNWSDMISFVKKGFMRRFKSFIVKDEFRKDQHIVMQNKFFEIAVVDDEWCAAWCLLERRDANDTGRNRTLMRRHYQSYLEAIKHILIEGWGEAIGYGGAWVSGRRYRAEDVAHERASTKIQLESVAV